MFAAVRRIGYPALAIAAALLASDAAWAVCTPAAGNNVTATCTGTTFDQNIVGNGYDTGTETGLSVTVVPGASVAGTNNGIDFTAGTVTNSGSIASAAFGFTGITATTSATVTNSGTISGTTFGIDVSAGSATVTNSGTIRGTGTPFSSAITATTVASVTNSGTISASFYGIDAGSVAVVVNSGTISENRVGGAAIEAPTAIVTNSGTSPRVQAPPASAGPLCS
jgi:hypothetical protein